MSAAPPAAVAALEPTPPPDELPEGATCAVHAGTDARFVCTRCGSFGCEACCFATVKARSVCQACADKGLGHPIPWERRTELGIWRAFWDTVRLSSRSPTRFFRTPPTREGVFGAVAHAVIASTLGVFLSNLVLGLMVMIGGGATAIFAPVPQADAIGTLVGGYGCLIAGMSPIALLAAPANAMMSLVWSAAAAHGVLALAGKARGSFEDTLRAVSYAGSPYVWQWVPIPFMSLIAWGWMMRVETIAVRETHRCGTDWAVAACVIHRVVLLVTFVVVYLLVVAGMASLILAKAGEPLR